MGAENSAAYRSPVRFDSYEVDFNSGELRKHGVRIRLQDQPLRILQLLLNRPGQLIPREELVRQLWPEGTFVDYDHSLNAAVAKLRQALLDSADKPQYIETIGRRGYRFIGEVKVPAHSARLATPPRSRIWAFVLVVLILTLAAGFYYYFHGTNRKLPPARVVPLTSYPGRQITPALSPDGKQVAFSWDGEKGDSFDIYVKMVDAGSPLRLTTSPAADLCPVWSPDSRNIAFIRSLGDRTEIWMVPALGGAERKLGESVSWRAPSWSPNGQLIVLDDEESPSGPHGLSLLALETGEKRTLTSPLKRYLGDFGPQFSPDGKTIAFIRASSNVTADLYVLPVNPAGTPGGDPKRLTSRGEVFQLDWTPDSKTIVFSSDQSGSIGLWTIPASGGVPERLTVESENVIELSVSRTGSRLVYTRRLFDSNIWRVAGPNSPDRNGAPIKLITSTRQESGSQFSPDMKKIVFSSNRSGNDELWICDAAGQDCGQLTSSTHPSPGSPRWSPDSRSIAFDSPKAGNQDIYVISAEGGPVHRVTTAPSNNVRPSWSGDGRWIYFGSNRTGEWQIWKSSPQGGQAVQVTRAKGAREALESLDGKFVYYVKLDRPGIWRIPAQGGEETRVLEQGQMGLWAVGRNGICFFDLAHPDPPALKFYGFANRQTMLVRQLPNNVRMPLESRSVSVSTDGRWILYTQVDQDGSDLMLVENFR
jgi:Tol biopolymer transport system component/DNA-binding winged helix-turn-helix (wHTH) protein